MKNRDVIIVGMKDGAVAVEANALSKESRQFGNLGKIERLRRSIANGSYQVSSAQVADNLIQVMRGQKGVPFGWTSSEEQLVCSSMETRRDPTEKCK